MDKVDYDRHKRAGGDEAGDFVFDGINGIERFLDGGRQQHAPGVLDEAEGQQQKRRHPEQRAGKPREFGFLLIAIAFEVLITANGADAEQRRNGDASDHRKRLSDLHAGR